MKTFKDLEQKPHPVWDGTTARMVFDNEYGVSVIRAAGDPFGGSYGHEDGLYELAVLGKDGSLSYETPITDDVLGSLTEDEVTNIMKQVQELN